MKKLFYLIIAVALIQGCKKEIGNNSQTNLSGRFSLSLKSNLKSAKIESNDSANFVLDTIKSSRSFYFILSNVGQSDITNITITTDNSDFSVTPSAIQVLPGTNNKNSSVLNQAISLDIAHGTRINGVGYTGLLNMGDNYCHINIQGVTSNGITNDTVKLRAIVKVFAKVMAVKVYQGSKEFNFAKPVRKVIGGPFDINAMNYFYYLSNEPPIVLKNTGNVSINITLANFDANSTILQNVTLQLQDTVVLILSTQPTGYGAGGYIRLNSNGTIFDQQKFSLGNDGNAYFGMVYWQATNSAPVPPNDSIYVH